MSTSFNKSAAICLLLGALLMVLTMVLHPVGGSFEALLKITTMAIVSHGIAIFSIPFSGLGFWGLSRRLDKAPLLSWLAFSMMATGLMATMIAAAVNGLAQPLFAERYRGAAPETIEALRPVFHYNMALNHAFDYILIAAIFCSTLLWSLAIVRTQALPRWVGFLGILLVAVGFISMLTGFYFLDLYGLRFLVFGWVLWIGFVAVNMYRTAWQKPSPLSA